MAQRARLWPCLFGHGTSPRLRLAIGESATLNLMVSTKRFIFVSCGQFTEAEKKLGSAIVSLVKSVTGHDAFFAEEVHDLNGLDSNILDALRNCAGFITVMHPRGHITRPNKTGFVRGSVWIEQEIAIATYIQRMERRPLPVIAFIHESVGREGIRDLLHLNPIPFVDESDVLSKLCELLPQWKELRETGIRLEVKARRARQQDGHQIRQFVVSLVNDTNRRIEKFNVSIRVPSPLFKHFSGVIAHEVPSDDSRVRLFRFEERAATVASPHSTIGLMTLDYCTHCAMARRSRLEDSTTV
jgi:hypothetical protein